VTAPPDRAGRGRRGEAVAEAFLVARGFRVLARNHRIRRGEVDLVCLDGDVLCFVEVRSREAGGPVLPEESVDRRKARRVVVAATDWAVRNGGLERPIRFDVVAVEHGEPGAPLVRHFPGAFDADGEAP
jgi:putative endonuclease